MMFNRSFPLESLVNSSVGNFKSLILPLSTISTIVPASSELRARRPDILAGCDSFRVSTARCLLIRHSLGSP